MITAFFQEGEQDAYSDISSDEDNLLNSIPEASQGVRDYKWQCVVRGLTWPHAMCVGADGPSVVMLNLLDNNIIISKKWIKLLILIYCMQRIEHSLSAMAHNF